MLMMVCLKHLQINIIRINWLHTLQLINFEFSIHCGWIENFKKDNASYVILLGKRHVGRNLVCVTLCLFVIKKYERILTVMNLVIIFMIDNFFVHRREH
jgi:hypothetical protein